MRLSKHHDLKCWPYYFNEVLSGNKTFEVRFNDRDFKEGDTLVLHEFNPDLHSYSGRVSKKYEIVFILELNKYLNDKKNYVVFSIRLADSEVK